MPEGGAYTLRDFAKKIQWGQFKSLQKFMEMLISIHELLGEGENMAAWAQTVQCLKAIHQVTLDNGNWRNAWPVTGLVDPGRRRPLGMSYTDAEVVNDYTKTQEDLEKRVNGKKDTDKDKDKGKKDGE